MAASKKRRSPRPPRSETVPLPDRGDEAKPSPKEWLAALLLVLAGLIVRGAAPGRMAVEHFDEGVYASNLWFGAEQRFRYPARHLYAPPLVPWVAEWSQVFLGPTHWGSMLPGVLAGTLTVALCWWALRRWFGPAAGLSAAALAAFSDYHGLYSRTVLTEPVLCFLLLLAVYWIWRALVAGDARFALVAGFCTGLAWITKYNGWLPLAIGAAGMGAWFIFPPAPTAPRARRFLILGITALVSLVVVFPVWWDLQADGGYRVVQENHARYLVGLSGWATAWQRQLGNHQFLDGPLSWAGLGLAVLLSRLVSGNGDTTAKSPPVRGVRCIAWTLACLAAIVALGIWWGTSAVLGLLGIGWLISACPCWQKTAADPDSQSRDLAYWFLAAWFIGLLLATPLYTPYPRLSLPWLLAAWITAAAMIASPSAQKFLAGQYAWQTDTWSTVIAVLGSAGLWGVGTLIVAGEHRSPTWENRTGLEQVAAEIEALLQKNFAGEAVVYIYAEPGLFYHLQAQGIAAVPVADLRFATQSPPVPVLLAFGPHAERTPAFQAEWKQQAERFELLGDFSYHPSDLVLLNHSPPNAIRDRDLDRVQAIRIYRTIPP